MILLRLFWLIWLSYFNYGFPGRYFTVDVFIHLVISQTVQLGTNKAKTQFYHGWYFGRWLQAINTGQCAAWHPEINHTQTYTDNISMEIFSCILILHKSLYASRIHFQWSILWICSYPQTSQPCKFCFDFKHLRTVT